jgi:hypothetical protein
MRISNIFQMISVSTVSESDWIKGISLSILASILGAASKLAIRKSWLLQKSIQSAASDQDEVEATETGVLQSHTRVLQLLSEESSRCLFPDGMTPMPDSNNIKPSLWPAYALRFSGMMGMTVFNPLCGVLAMNYASPSILAPFSGLTLVWIIVLSDALIHERATNRQIAASALIIAGEIVISVFGDHTNDANVTVQQVVRWKKENWYSYSNARSVILVRSQQMHSLHSAIRIFTRPLFSTSRLSFYGWLK